VIDARRGTNTHRGRSPSTAPFEGWHAEDVTDHKPDWARYQADVARFFRDLGMEAHVDYTLAGARTSHDIDVLVRGSYVGFEIMWIVECKAWMSRVPKEKVLALRQIVDDVGADRGFMMAEAGYQSGALQAALLSNVTLTSVAELTERLRYDLAMTKLAKLERRADEARQRYWHLDKTARIESGLRPDVGGAGYSGNQVISAVDYALREVRLKGFPVIWDPLAAVLASYGSRYVPSHEAETTAIGEPELLFKVLDSELATLEAKLHDAEASAESLRHLRRPPNT
jgi:restriction system protein